MVRAADRTQVLGPMVGATLDVVDLVRRGTAGGAGLGEYLAAMPVTSQDLGAHTSPLLRKDLGATLPGW